MFTEFNIPKNNGLNGRVFIDLSQIVMMGDQRVPAANTPEEERLCEQTPIGINIIFKNSNSVFIPNLFIEDIEPFIA